MREYIEWLLGVGEHIVSALEDAIKRWLGGYWIWLGGTWSDQYEVSPELQPLKEISSPLSKKYKFHKKGAEYRREAYTILKLEKEINQ